MALPGRRRVSVVLISALVVVGAVAGCGGEDGDAEGQSPDTEDASASTSDTPAAEGESASDGVAITDFSFDPASLTVPVGTTLTWTNEDPATHTVTADDEAFSSGEIAEGEIFEHRFDEVGQFTYHCNIHSDMAGDITVE